MINKVVIAGVTVILSMAAGCQVRQPVGPIALSRLTGDYWQVWTMQPDGKSAKQLTASPSDKRYPVWAQEAKKILFRTNNNSAYMVDPATGKETAVLEPFGLIGSLAHSPVGRRLLFVRFRNDLKDSSDIWTSTLDGENQKILTRNVGLQYDPAWSDDGKKIAYISGHGYQTHELYIMDSDGRNKQRLTNNKALELLPAISPDGKTIAYVSDHTGDYEIWLMDIDGRNPRQISFSYGIDTRPVWSPDGEQIMFVSNRSGNQQVWIMNKDGDNARQLTTGTPSIIQRGDKELF